MLQSEAVLPTRWLDAMARALSPLQIFVQFDPIPVPRLKLSKIPVDGNVGGAEGLALEEGLREALGETLPLGLTEGEALADGERLGELEALGLTLADGLRDGLEEPLGLTLAEGLTLDEGETEGEPVELSYSARKMAALSPETASVGLEVSPVLVLMRNSPRTRTAFALLRERVPVSSVKLVLGVRLVVLLASLPPPMRYNRLRDVRPEMVFEPKPLLASRV